LVLLRTEINSQRVVAVISRDLGNGRNDSGSSIHLNREERSVKGVEPTGYDVWRHLRDHNGGTVELDMEGQRLTVR
jgi:hypothetical protein